MYSPINSIQYDYWLIQLSFHHNSDRWHYFYCQRRRRIDWFYSWNLRYSSSCQIQIWIRSRIILDVFRCLSSLDNFLNHLWRQFRLKTCMLKIKSPFVESSRTENRIPFHIFQCLFEPISLDRSLYFESVSRNQYGSHHRTCSLSCSNFWSNWQNQSMMTSTLKFDCLLWVQTWVSLLIVVIDTAMFEKIGYRRSSPLRDFACCKDCSILCA